MNEFQFLGVFAAAYFSGAWTAAAIYGGYGKGVILIVLATGLLARVSVFKLFGI